MGKVTELEMKECILNLRSFTGSSAKGLNYDNDYLVYSYDTLIFRKSDNYFDNAKYSATTSKLQNMIIDCFNLNAKNKTRDKK